MIQSETINKNRAKLIDKGRKSDAGISFKSLIEDIKNPSFYSPKELRAIAIKSITILSNEGQKNIITYCSELAENLHNEAGELEAKIECGLLGYCQGIIKAVFNKR